MVGQGRWTRLYKSFFRPVEGARHRMPYRAVFWQRFRDRGVFCRSMNARCRALTPMKKAPARVTR
jgi:hypothetical protein